MFKKFIFLSFVLFISIIMIENDNHAEAQQNTPAGIVKLFNKMAPQEIGNIVSCYHEGEIWLFYEKMPFISEPFPNEGGTGQPVWHGKTYCAVWNGTKWSKEKEFDSRVYDAVSDGKKMIIFVEGGYRVFEGTHWSDINNVEGLSNPFTCLSPEGIYIFYNKSDDLVYRKLQGDVLTTEKTAQSNWTLNKGTPSFMNQNYSRAIYAFDKIWLFYTKEGPSLFYQIYSNKQWSDEKFLVNAMQYSPVVRNGQIYVFYVNWLPPDPEKMSVSTAFKTMMRANYMRYDGYDWSGPDYVQTGQTVLVDSLDIKNDLWLFIGSMASINYLKLSDGNWSKMKSINKTSPERIFAIKGFAMNFIFFIFFTIIVCLVSKNIEKKKKVFLDIGQRQYEAASLLKRYIAHAIDFVVLCLLWMMAGRKMISPEGDVLFGNFWVTWSVMFFGYFLGCLLYFVILEGKWGRTVGKFITKIKVVSVEGERCGFKKALIRNLLRIIDGFLGYLIGALVFETSEKHQRLGDKVGKTYVVLNKS